ncbi:MAG TPA: class I SAM-dependent methyltransferase [Candidatus Baltobacteraceae bacterium]|nr:class I SAM-dependent methyltransferase [Candidatus Baltobacteraceae bacterium]
MTDQWAALAQEYANSRSGYSNELYDTIAQFGLRRNATILDVGCGTGLASEPFATNGFPVTGVDPSEAMLAAASQRLPSATFVKGEAEALPFPNERFDVVISAQTFHWIDRARALAEAYRVLRRGGIVAIWWKHIMSNDAIKILRDDVIRELGKDPIESGLGGGFKEFYASPFVQQTLRVLPWRIAMPLDRYLGYERSRCSVRKALGAKADDYFRRLESRLHERVGPGNPTISLAYIQYLYMAKKL